MKDVYTRPQAEVVTFVPNKAIAMEQPEWGWEDGVFSTPEAQTFDEKNMEGGNGYEG